MTRAFGIAVFSCLIAGDLGTANAEPTPKAPAKNEDARAGSPPRDATRSASGLAMQVLVMGRGTQHPRLNDCVRVRFEAWVADGHLFARSPEDGSPELLCIRRLTRGVAEAVRALVVGEQRRVWVPSRLNTAADEPGDRKPPDLLYEITLVGIIEAPPTPIPLKSAPANARRLPSGLALRLLQRGTGKVHPSPMSKVTVHLSGWTSDGALFESTRMGGQPAVYVVQELLPGLREGVEQLVVGDRVRLLIPAALAYARLRHRRGQPAGSMVYDQELIDIE